ncbi:pleckstrin homology domain-containing family A member 2 [Athene cunicularia]|uniref:pleckstrin homology domain-containing family A member 2 n=1 Tax=Athene cunicularia TaxID=194338 RepID=UPI000EF71D88|nr:pleckstrin homology domain-containing family A member 2 [Athene cunicularia]
MPYLDRQNRICGFLDIEENETCGKFLRRYFILDTQANCLLWYMDNPQNLAIGAGAVGSLQLTYISKVSIATPKQKPKTPFCFVINALSQRYFLQASDQKDLQDWVEALNRASKITVPKGGSVPPAAEITKPPVVAQAQERKPQVAYKTEIIGGVVVHTPISINQVSWQDPHTAPDPGGKIPATSAPRFGVPIPHGLRAAPKGDKQKRQQLSPCVAGRGRSHHSPAPCCRGPSAPELGFAGPSPQVLCLAPASKGKRPPASTWVCKSLVANAAQISASGREGTGKASVGVLFLLYRLVLARAPAAPPDPTPGGDAPCGSSVPVSGGALGAGPRWRGESAGAQHRAVSSSLVQRKSWKRRFFVLDEFSISYYKCEQDKEPLRSILLKDVCKSHECLVKSGDLLMRDNLFEIITTSRTFYIQADSPEDMRSWIRAITGAVQALKFRPREMSFMRSTSVAKPGGSSGGPQQKQAVEERRALCRAPPSSSSSSWQPWTPVPQAGGRQPVPGEVSTSTRDSVFTPALPERDGGAAPGRRVRHRSEPQHLKEKPFAFDLDDESIRTSDV